MREKAFRTKAAIFNRLVSTVTGLTLTCRSPGHVADSVFWFRMRRRLARSISIPVTSAGAAMRLHEAPRRVDSELEWDGTTGPFLRKGEGGGISCAPRGTGGGGTHAVKCILVKCHSDSPFLRRRESPGSPGPLGTDASFVRPHYSFMDLLSNWVLLTCRRRFPGNIKSSFKTWSFSSFDIDFCLSLQLIFLWFRCSVEAQPGSARHTRSAFHTFLQKVSIN